MSTFQSGYSSQTSGFLSGGGIRFAKRKSGAIRGRKTKNFPTNIHITDYSALRHLVPEYDPDLEFEYTQWELHVLAEKMLLEDEKPYNEEPYYLTCDQLRRRQTKEIIFGSGIVDEVVAEGLYWRTHPNGRPWYTPDEMKRSQSGFYK